MCRCGGSSRQQGVSQDCSVDISTCQPLNPHFADTENGPDCLVLLRPVPSPLLVLLTRGHTAALDDTGTGSGGEERWEGRKEIEKRD